MLMDEIKFAAQDRDDSFGYALGKDRGDRCMYDLTITLPQQAPVANPLLLLGEEVVAIFLFFLA